MRFGLFDQCEEVYYKVLILASVNCYLSIDIAYVAVFYKNISLEGFCIYSICILQ